MGVEIILFLYDPKETSFRTNGEPVRNGYGCHVIRNKSEFYLEFKVTIDKNGYYKNLKRGMIIRAMTPDGLQPFRIVDKKKRGDHVFIEAYHVFFDLGNKIVSPISINNGPLVSALAQYLNSFKSGHAPFTISAAGFDKSRTFNTSKDEMFLDALSVLIEGKHSIVGTWEAELLINGFDIRLVDKVGKQTNALLHEQKNISDFEDEESDKDIITRIYATSKFTPERKEGDEKEPEEVILSVVVDSPIINQYSKVYEATYVNNDCKTEEELKRWAGYKFSLEKVDLPKRNITVRTNIIDGTEIGYGDRLVLKYSLHDVNEVIRCVGYDYDGINEVFYSVELGSTATSVGDSVRGQINDTTKGFIGNELNKIAERVTTILMSADGIHRTAYGPDPVPNPIEGDMWFKYSHDDPSTVELWEFRNGEWVLVIDDFTGKRVLEKIEELEKQAKDLDESIAENYRKIEEALKKAGFAVDVAERAEKAIEETKESIEEAKKKIAEQMEKSEKAIAEFEDIENTVSDFDKQIKSFEDFRSEVSQKIDMTAEIVGNDGATRYNKNRLKEATEKRINLGDNPYSVSHNGDGFIPGEEYTISFDMECILKALSTLKFTMDKKAYGNISIKLTPHKKGYPSFEAENVQLPHEIKVLQTTYMVGILSEFYNSETYEINAIKDAEIKVELDYKNNADGDKYTGEWAEEPELIFDGGDN